MLISQKNLFEEIIKSFPGETPSEIIKQLKLAKKGSTIMLESFTNMNKEMSEMKKYQKDLDKKYEKKIEYLTNENDQLLNEKKENKEKYIKNINEMRNRMNFFSPSPLISCRYSSAASGDVMPSYRPITKYAGISILSTISVIGCSSASMISPS